MKAISTALVKAQKEFGTAHKTSSNPFFKSKYADLSVVVDAVLGALNNNGIALIQNCHESDTGVVVETTFLHESGECISCGKLSVPAAKNDPQGYGSALTYARRYSLMAACGIAPEDDDGNAATKAVIEKAAKKVEPQPMALYTVNPEQDLKCKGIAMDIVDFATKEMWDDAFLTYDNVSDHDERLCVWTHLKPNSAIRTKIKAMGEAQRNHPATQA
jgi:hypothetical protein